MEVKSNEVHSFDDLKNPGDILFTKLYGHGDDIAGMVNVCPCGCGERGSIAFDVPARNGEKPAWTWNGSHDKPTLTPSILKTTGCKWHGFLTDGIFRSC